jgi:hypothetical protein
MSCLRFSIALFVAVLAAQSAVRADFPDLAKRLPSDINSIVLVDMDKILASPAAEKNDWKNKIENAFNEGVTILPPAAKRAILASKLDLEFMSPIWQVEVLESRIPLDVTAVAKKIGGTIDRIGPLAAVRLPSDAYLVHFEKDVFGVMLPGNRQAVVRWLREVIDRTTPKLPAYLMEAQDVSVDVGTPVIMAIDLDGALSEGEIRERMKDNWKDAGLEGKADPLAVSKVLASIRGATLGITLRDRPFGKIKIDFAEDAKALANIAKPLFLHVLEHRGATIEEFEDWKYEVKGKQVTLEGHFTSSGLRRIFSMFDRPASMMPVADKKPETPEEVTPENKERQMAAATKAYYNQVQQLLKDLKGRKSGGGTYTTGSIAQWCTNYARKINNLPLLNVDPEMLDYGNKTSQTLLQVAAALNGGNVQGGIEARSSAPVTNTYTATNVYGYGYRGGWFGGGIAPLGYTNSATVIDPLQTTAQRENIKANARATSSKQARELFSGIDTGTAEIRQKMVQKYQIEF